MPVTNPALSATTANVDVPSPANRGAFGYMTGLTALTTPTADETDPPATDGADRSITGRQAATTLRPDNAAVWVSVPLTG